MTWQPIETFEPQGPDDPAKHVLIVAGSVVGEAYFRNQGDHDDGWWWANTDGGDYYAEKIEEHLVTHWQALPPLPSEG